MLKPWASRCALVVGLVLGVALSVYVPSADATRNSAGTHSLPSGNPVVSGTTITAANENAFRADVSTEITNSLDRNGRGAMLAPLQCSNGTVAAPSLTFGSDLDTGLYRIGANNPAMAAGATKSQEWTASGTSIPGTLAVTGASTLTGDTAVTGNLTTANTVTLNAGGPSLKLKPGASNDHVYAEFYADSAAASTRSGFLGYGVAGTSTLTLQNEMTNGGIYLAPNGTGVVELAKNAKLSGGNPAATTAFTNTLTAASVVKAWGKVTTDGGGGISLVDGFNLTTPDFNGNNIRINLAASGAMADTKYGVVVTPYGTVNSTSCRVASSGISTTSFTLICYDGGSLQNCTTAACGVSFIVIGAQ